MGCCKWPTTARSDKLHEEDMYLERPNGQARLSYSVVVSARVGVGSLSFSLAHALHVNLESKRPPTQDNFLGNGTFSGR
jgi:hypothetical protein